MAKAKRKRSAAPTATGRKKSTGKSAGAARKRTTKKASTRKTTARKSARRPATRASAAAGGTRARKAARRKSARKTAARKATSRKATSRKAARKATSRKAASRTAARTGRTRKAPRAASRRSPATAAPRRPAPGPGAPSSLDFDRSASAARTGRAEIREALENHTETGPELTGGDVDASWEDAYAVGDEAPGGDSPTPDQDVVEEIGRSLGLVYEDNEELKGASKIEERDKHRWELDPASSEDYDDRERE